MRIAVLISLCLGCAGPQTVPTREGSEGSVNPEPRAPVETAVAEEEYDSPCADYEPAPTPVAEPYVLSCDDVERREGSEPERSGTVNRLLRLARAAQREERFEDAIGAFERAKRAAPADAGVIGELGWARFNAALACDADVDDSEGEMDSCVATVSEAESDLTEAAAAAVSDARRGVLLYNLGRVSLHTWQLDDATDRFRRSQCLRPNDTVRKALAEVWALRADRAWESADGQGAVDALTIAGQLDPARQPAAAQALERWRDGLSLERLAARELDPAETLEELCEGEPCELLGDWVQHEGWALGHLRVEEGIASAFHVLVARTSNGLSVVADLGSELGDSRRGNGYVREAFIEPLEDAPFSMMSATFGWGSATAEGCDWLAEAWATVLLCAHHEGVVHCFASARLGPEVFESDSMLPTVQESLGRCPDYAPPLVRDNDVTPNFSVNFTPREMVVEREHDGMVWCTPLREALCSGEHAPAACAAE